MASTQRFFGLIEHREVVRHEEGVELGAFEFLDEGFEMLEVEVRIRVCAWVAPCARVEGHWAHEGCKVELFLGCHFLNKTEDLGAVGVLLHGSYSGDEVGLTVEDVAYKCGE